MSGLLAAETNRVPSVAPSPRAISRIGGRWIPWDRSVVRGGSVPFLLEQVLTPGVDSPSLRAVLLPRLPRAGLRNAFFTVLVAHAVPLPIKEPPSQQKKRGSGHTAVEVAGRTVIPTAPHRPGWRNGGMTFRRRAYNATWVAIVSGLWKALHKAACVLSQHPV